MTTEASTGAENAVATEETKTVTATSVGDLPPEVFEENEMSVSKEQQPEPEQESPEQPVDTKEPVAEEKTAEKEETAPEQAQATEEPAKAESFDYVAFAKENGVSDSDLFKNCKDEDAAIRTLARRASHFSKIYGDQANKLGDANKRVKQLEEQLAAKQATPQPPAETEQDADGTEKFFDEFNTAPKKVLEKAYAEREEALLKKAKELYEQERLDRDAKSELEAFGNANPGWEARKPEMQATVSELGEAGCPPFQDLYEIAGLRSQDPKAYGEVIAKMRKGYSWTDAKVLCVEHPKAVGETRSADVTGQASARAGSQRAFGPSRTAISVQKPVVKTTSTSIAQLSRDIAGGIW